MKPDKLYDNRIKILEIAVDIAKQQYGRGIDRFSYEYNELRQKSHHIHDHSHDENGNHDNLKNDIEDQISNLEYPNFTLEMIEEVYQKIEKIILDK